MDTTPFAGSAAADLAQKLGRLKELARVDPGNERLSRDCIALALEAGDYAFALDRLDVVLARSPEDLQARFDRATALIGNKEYGAASGLLREILQTPPSDQQPGFNA